MISVCTATPKLITSKAALGFISWWKSRIRLKYLSFCLGLQIRAFMLTFFAYRLNFLPANPVSYCYKFNTEYRVALTVIAINKGSWSRSVSVRELSNTTTNLTLTGQEHWTKQALSSRKPTHNTNHSWQNRDTDDS